MAKISRVSLARKRELEQPDVVLSFLQRASLWVAGHRLQTAVAAGAFIAVVVILAGATFFSSRAEKKAFDRLTQIAPANAAAEADQAADVAEQYRLLNKKYNGTVAGKIAGLKYADACYQNKDYEKAIAAYRKALSDFDDVGFLKKLALTGLGYTYEAIGDDDQAVSCFTRILEDPQVVVKDEALFHLGRLYGRQGDVKNTREMFGRIVADYPDSLYADIAREGSRG